MKFVLLAENNKNVSVIFANWWKVSLLTLIVFIIFYILIPKDILGKILNKDSPSAASVSYLRAFHQKMPKNLQISLSLIEHEIEAGNLQAANQEIVKLKAQYNFSTNNLEPELKSYLNVQLRWIDYLILKYKSVKAKPISAKRLFYLLQLRKMTQTLANLPLETKQLTKLANDSISLGQEKLALAIYLNLLKHNQLTTTAQIAKGAAIALQNNAPLKAYEFYKQAFVMVNSSQEKQKYALAMLEALWAANSVKIALAEALRLPDAIKNTKPMQLYIAKIALANNELKTAELFILRALNLPLKLANLNSPKTWNFYLQKINYDDDALSTLYYLLLYQSQIKAAYAVARIALAHDPNNLEWRKKFAKTAIWAGKYNQGLNALFFIATKDKNSIPEAIDIAKKLGYDIVVAELLAIFLSENPDDNVKQIEFALYLDKIGNPEKSLKILQKLSNNYQSRRVYELQATIYQQLAKWKKALQIWQSIDKKYGPNRKSLLEQAYIYYNHGDFIAALNILKNSFHSTY